MYVSHQRLRRAVRETHRQRPVVHVPRQRGARVYQLYHGTVREICEEVTGGGLRHRGAKVRDRSLYMYNIYIYREGCDIEGQR